MAPYKISHELRMAVAPVLLGNETVKVEVLKSYLDGIILADPANLVVKVNGRISAETEYFREVSFACLQARCLGEAANSTFAVVPDQTWVVEGTALIARSNWSMKALGTLLHLWQHSDGYLLSSLLLLVPVYGLRRAATIPPPDNRLDGSIEMVYVLTSIGSLGAWFFVIMMYTELWLLWSLAIALIVFLTDRAIRSRRANNASQPQARRCRRLASPPPGR